MRSLVAPGYPLSTDPLFGLAQSFRYTTPGGPSPCPQHYTLAFGYSATSAPPAHWHCRVLPREVKRCGSSPGPVQQTAQRPVAASSTPGAQGDNARQRSDVTRPAPSHVGSGVSQPLSPRPRHDTSDRGFLRPHRSQDSNGPPRMARRGRPFLHRLPTPVSANHRRPLHSPQTVVHVWFSTRTICCTVKGRTRIGIGGGLATSPLPHHRTYGSRIRRFGGVHQRRERHRDVARLPCQSSVLVTRSPAPGCGSSATARGPTYTCSRRGRDSRHGAAVPGTSAVPIASRRSTGADVGPKSLAP